MQLLFTWNPSPLQSSSVSLEYLLLPPRSALTVAPGLLSQDTFVATVATLLLAATWRTLTHFSQQRLGMGRTLQRHPFSGLVDSAGELLHTP